MNLRASTRVEIGFFVIAALISLLFTLPARAQTTSSTGNIRGTVTDPNGALVRGAEVTITNEATGSSFVTRTTPSGLYASGVLIPGTYRVKVSVPQFKSAELPVTVNVGVTANGDVQLTAGQGTETLPGRGAFEVNTRQATVQSVLMSGQIDVFPINGRNFLDLAQLEPGVQIQDGSTFDPTKNGFSSISFEGRYGRATRIELDGADISDEIVGATTQNISATAIQEFQLAQSSLDLSSELTSSGAVNIVTRSGGNQIHGEGFGLFRGNQIAASLPGLPSPTFQREQFGGSVGGALIKDRLFLFIDGERSKQDLTAAQPFAFPFDGLNTTLREPFRETMADARLDWQIRDSMHMFYRFNFDQNSQIRPFGSASSLQGFRTLSHTPSHTVGLDFNRGPYTHSIRASLLEFRNTIVDGTQSIPAGVDNPIPGLGINIGASTAGMCVLSNGGAYCGGPSLLAPQATSQSNRQIKYDGSKLVDKHAFRYGVAFNRIQGGGFAGFYASPQVGTIAAGSESNPTAYPIQFAALGNGTGFRTPLPALGFPGGGLGPDNRVEAYVGDAWKATPHVLFNYGLHYVRDSGRVDSDLGALPVLNQWGPGLGNQVRTPNTNFAPQAGLAWDVGGNGKSVFRMGAGLFYDNSIWNNVYFDNPARVQNGLLAANPFVCQGGASNIGPGFPWPTDPGPAGTPLAGGAGLSNGNGTASATFCNDTIAAGAASVLALSNAFKAAAATRPLTLQPNPNFVGTTLSAANVNGFDLFNPNYRTPRSWQMNLGIEHQFGRGLVFSADYVRNIGEYFLMVVDRNRSGAAYSFNLANAVAARDRAQLANGCPAGAGAATCMVTALGQAGAQGAYSAAGLDSNVQSQGGAPCNFCAFPGTNPVSGNSGRVGTLDMLSPVGRSVYSGLQVRLVETVNSPMRAVEAATFQLSYAMARFVSPAQDQDFISLPTNNDNPSEFTGPNALDRRHQISFGGTFDLPFLTRLSLIGHVYSSLPQSLFLPQLTSGGEIFATDWLGTGLGSGSPGEPVPGTEIGQFGRSTNVANMQTVINNYNVRFAGTLTPAGHQLVNDSVMTTSDMSLLGWVMPQLPSVPGNARDFGWLKDFDLKARWPIRMKDRLTLEPSVSIFNLFNLSNSFLGGNLPLASLIPSDLSCVQRANCAATSLAPNVVGGVTSQSVTPFRATFQSGTFALGVPRQIEFGMRVEF